MSELEAAVAFQQGVSQERERCIAILNWARGGEIDTDLRSLISRIRCGDSLEKQQAE